MRQTKLQAFGQLLPSEPLNLEEVESVGFTLADKKAGDFQLEIESIKAVKEVATTAAAKGDGNIVSADSLIELAITRGFKIQPARFLTPKAPLDLLLHFWSEAAGFKPYFCVRWIFMHINLAGACDRAITYLCVIDAICPLDRKLGVLPGIAVCKSTNGGVTQWGG